MAAGAVREQQEQGLGLRAPTQAAHQEQVKQQPSAKGRAAQSAHAGRLSPQPVQLAALARRPGLACTAPSSVGTRGVLLDRLTAPSSSRQ